LTFDEVFAWVRDALHASLAGEKREHEAAIGWLRAERATNRVLDLGGHFLHGGLALGGALVLSAFGSASRPASFFLAGEGNEDRDDQYKTRP
jgi:hypothetical protein